MIFAFVLDQTAAGSAFVRIHSGALPIHIISGLGGWLTITTMGVSYRLLAMFMLVHDIDEKRSRVTLWSASAALGIVVGGGFVAVLAEMSLAVALASALVLAVQALALYGRDVLQLYRSRRRRSLELNSRMGAIALANLALSALLCVVLAALGRFSEYVGAVVFLFAFGWLSGFMLAQLYKIVAFLTWLEVYGPVLGKAPTPRVQDLVAERLAMRWFLLFFAGVWGATGALLAGSLPVFRIAVLAMTAATCGIVREMMKSRRLSYVPVALRLPGNALRPMLLIAATRHP
jgi:hypothetical protein